MLGVELWMVGVVATTFAWVSYVGIAATLLRGLLDGRQWASNYLGMATALIFATCAAGHGMHVMHALLPVTGTDLALGSAARVVFGDARLVLVNVAAGGVAVWYLSLRNRLRFIWRGSTMFDDMRERQERALEINDNVVQNLSQAKLALEAGDRELALDLVDETLDDSKHLITDILGDEGSELVFDAGDMHRPDPAELSEHTDDGGSS